MTVYIIAVVVIVAIVSVFFNVLLNKNKLLGIRTILAITLSSIAISLAMPFFIGRFINISQDGQVSFGNISLTITVCLTVYAAALLLLTFLISSLIQENTFKSEDDTVKGFFKNRFIHNKQDLHEKVQEQGMLGELEPESAVMKEFEEGIPDLAGEQINGALYQDENIFEKSVDREQIIDKMGVETIDKISDVVEDSEITDMKDLYIDDSFDENGNYVINMDELEIAEDFGLNASKQETQYINEEKNADNINDDSPNESFTIEDFINKAFEYKAKGEFEEAILNYMYALDKSPEKDLVFWIILDICVLYKYLGQIELAAEILEGYISNYGELMDESVKMEIERNLSYA